MAEDIFDAMVTAWGSPIVARVEAQRFAGGGTSGKLLANHDALGVGPKGKFTIGRKVCYPTVELANWLRSRSSKA